MEDHKKTCQAIRGHERSAQATGYTIWGSYPGRYKTFLSSNQRPDRLWGSPSLLFEGKWRSYPAIKRSAHDVDHSSSSRAEVKEKARLKFPPPVCLHWVHKYNFTLTFQGAYSGFPNYRTFHLEFQQVLKSVTTFLPALTQGCKVRKQNTLSLMSRILQDGLNISPFPWFTTLALSAFCDVHIWMVYPNNNALRRQRL
jgi:hypothetical protein